MRYHCVQCDQEFELAEGEEKPRCPKCLRQHGLRAIEGKSNAKPTGGARGRVAGFITALLLVAAAGGGYWFWTRSQSSAAGATATVDADSLRTAAGFDVGDAGDLLRADDAIEAFAKRATDGKSSDADKAAAVAKAIQERGKKQAFVPWSMLEPREAPAMTAAKTFAAIAKDGARVELYPLEAAALAVAALRSADVPAHLVEVHAFGGERAPLDPSGRLGYFAVGLAPEKEGGRARVFDVYGGRPEAASPDATALNDMQAAGCLLAVRGLSLLAHGGDPGGALRHADAAVKLAPSSAAVRGVRGAVLLASGGKDEGARELEAAGQLRGGPAQQNNLAMFALATGDTDRAAKLVAQALSANPDYASGHLTLASVHLARIERDQARAELMQAERLDPRLPALPLAWAELYAGQGDYVNARLKAEEAVRARPKSPETHLLLARVYRQAGNYDGMRQEARKVLELAPASQKDETREVLKAVLGPTALDTDAAEPSDPAAAPAAPDAKLTQDLGPGNLQLGAGEPKLRLGGDSKLKLDLSE